METRCDHLKAPFLLLGLLLPNLLTAQEGGWMAAGESSTGSFTTPWSSQTFSWVLPTLEGDLTGNLSINRTGAGLSYAGFESHAQTLLAYERAMEKYEGNSGQWDYSLLGLSSLHFVSEGENPNRGAIDDSPNLTESVTTFQYTFDDGQLAPAESLISLFDAGVIESNGATTSRGPQKYHFSASLDDTPVSTADWTLQIIDPYSPTGNSETTLLWNGTTGVLDVNFYTSSLGANFPDNIVLLKTGTTRFDSLSIEVNSLASELVAVGFASPNFVVVPEPSPAILCSLSLGLLMKRRRTREDRPNRQVRRYF